MLTSLKNCLFLAITEDNFTRGKSFGEDLHSGFSLAPARPGLAPPSSLPRQGSPWSQITSSRVAGALAAPASRGRGGGCSTSSDLPSAMSAALGPVLSYQGSFRFITTEISLEGRREEIRAGGGGRASGGRSDSQSIIPPPRELGWGSLTSDHTGLPVGAGPHLRTLKSTNSSPLPLTHTFYFNSSHQRRQALSWG